MEKKENGNQYYHPFKIKAVGKNIRWGRGEGDGNFGKKFTIEKNGGGEEYQVAGNFIFP